MSGKCRILVKKIKYYSFGLILSMSNFKEAPVYLSATTSSENRIINLDHIEEVTPHANVDVGAEEPFTSTACCQVRYHSGQEEILLIDYTSMKTNLSAITGTIDLLGNIS